ncbi:MAG: hypothetical protein IPQ06_06645 [Chitinophagaceae bacterium]|nr:hypothetical protein [Chitinophagaceae bacterium]
MKGVFLAITYFACFFSGLKAQNPDVPEELKPFVQKGYDVLDFAKEDMNGDKLPDYILILKIEGEDTMTFNNPDSEAARPLLLIIRQPDGILKLQVSNNELVLCRQCGGVMGDPYEGLTVKPGEFRVSFYGGSSWRWTGDFTFRYDKIKKNWFLQSHVSSGFQSGDPEKTMEVTVFNRSETGDISLQNFTAYYNTDSSDWKVNVPKTFFYKSPELRSKPQKAYLVKGNKLTSYKKFKNFIECSYTNNAGTTTYGFVLIKDLLLVQAKTPKDIR